MFVAHTENCFFTAVICHSLRAMLIAVSAVSVLDALHFIAHIYRLSVVLKEETIYLHLNGRLCSTWGWFTSQQNSMPLLSITSRQPSTCILHLQELSCCLLVSPELFVLYVSE